MTKRPAEYQQANTSKGKGPASIAELKAKKPPPHEPKKEPVEAPKKRKAESKDPPKRKKAKVKQEKPTPSIKKEEEEGEGDDKASVIPYQRIYNLLVGVSTKLLTNYLEGRRKKTGKSLVADDVRLKISANFVHLTRETLERFLHGVMTAAGKIAGHSNGRKTTTVSDIELALRVQQNQHLQAIADKISSQEEQKPKLERKRKASTAVMEAWALYREQKGKPHPAVKNEADEGTEN